VGVREASIVAMSGLVMTRDDRCTLSFILLSTKQRDTLLPVITMLFCILTCGDLGRQLWSAAPFGKKAGEIVLADPDGTTDAMHRQIALSDQAAHRPWRHIKARGDGSNFVQNGFSSNRAAKRRGRRFLTIIHGWQGSLQACIPTLGV
jgi:hypothetical protein